MSAPAETLSEPLLSQSSGSTTTTTSTSQKQQHVATAPPPYHQEDEEGGGGMGIAIEPLLVVVDDSNGPGPDEDLQRGQQQSPWEQYGHVQPKAFRDWPWAVLFLIQLIAVIVLAVFGMIHLFKHGAPINWWWPFSGDDDGPDPSPTQYDDDILKDDDGNHHGGAGGGGTSSSSADPFMNGLWFFLILTSSVIGLSAVMMNVLLGPLSGMMIQVSLVTSPLCFGFTTLVSLLTFNIPMLIFAGVMTILGIVYARSVWHRIPFATANINVAMAALKANQGLWILAYVMTVKAYLWTAIWASAFLEVFVYNPHWVYNCYTTSDSTSGEDTTIVCDWSTRGKFVVVGFFLSLFWTAQVLKNVFHTTIAGVVGTWWFAPDEATSTSALAAGARTVSTMEQGGDDQQVVFETTETGLGEHRTTNRCCCCCSFCGCSPAIFDSWVRSTFYSFGSICFGSLLVGILRLLQAIIRCGRQRRQQQQNMNGTSSPGSGDLCCCLLQCLVDHLEHLMEYFNQWSFVYVGLYGYAYLDAGKQVAALFTARGWSVIVNDYLVSRSLAMMSMLIGLITGVMGVVVGFFFFGPLAALQTFFIGAILGMTSTNILFGVVVSAINTIVVSFAEAPDSLRVNHSPELYTELVGAWRQAYPEQFRL